MNVLVINAGSSSLKYQLFDMDKSVVLAKGLCERIGIDGRLKHSPAGKDSYIAELPMKTHADAIKYVIDALVDKDHGVVKSLKEIDAVGHRVLHGGAKFHESVLIDEKVLEAIEECIPLGPLHNPANLTGIRSCAEVLGKDFPQVAVFDTAFHQSMPKKAFLYAIPYRYYTDYKIRRYGFHGTSHRYVSSRAAKLLGKPNGEGLKIITCHLGNGSSIAAVKNGECIDTSMGLTPLEGLPMGTRSGSIDPAIIESIANYEGKTAQQIVNMLNKESGMLGISGKSSDFRDLIAEGEKGDERCKIAVEIFIYAVRKYIGAYAAAMEGVDAVVFTGGVGENDKQFREAMCAGLDYMGISIDIEKNNNAKRGTELDISKDNSRAKILVIPTDEEMVIAQDTAEILQKK
ncbi:MAG: acetate kinase [Clostridiales bacterium]|nr:acetate kinase [Clostridiales bacterium]